MNRTVVLALFLLSSSSFAALAPTSWKDQKRGITTQATTRCWNFKTESSYQCCDNGKCGSVGSTFVNGGGAECARGSCSTY